MDIATVLSSHICRRSHGFRTSSLDVRTGLASQGMRTHTDHICPGDHTAGWGARHWPCVQSYNPSHYNPRDYLIGIVKLVKLNTLSSSVLSHEAHNTSLHPLAQTLALTSPRISQMRALRFREVNLPRLTRPGAGCRDSSPPSAGLWPVLSEEGLSRGTVPRLRWEVGRVQRSTERRAG